MFDPKLVATLQEAVRQQGPRKERIGQPDFAKHKLWEELSELQTELVEAEGSGVLGANLVDELGDFLFCVLADPVLAGALQARLEFNQSRLWAYQLRDEAMVNYPKSSEQLRRLKLTRTGWTYPGSDQERLQLLQLLRSPA